MLLAASSFGLPGARTTACGYCEDPEEITDIAGITRRAVAEDRPQEDDRPELLHVGTDQGFLNYQLDLASSDEQQKALISAISSGVTGYERVQGPAAAGAGKTRCVTLGVAGFYHKFVATGMVSPSEVVVTTFTKAAAKELTSRLSRYIPAHALSGGPQSLRIGTYHSRAVSQWHKLPGVMGKELSPGIESNILGVLLGDPYAAKAWGPHQEQDNKLVPWGVLGIVPLDVLTALQKSRGEAGREAADIISNRFEPWGIHSPDALRAFRKAGDDGSRRWDAVNGGMVYADTQYARAAEIISRRPGTFKPQRGLAVLAHIWDGMLKIKQARNFIGFGDILGAFLEHADKSPTKLFIVDEAQDNSWEQIQIAERSTRAGDGGRLLLIGDGRQCIPAGQKVMTPVGDVAIEDVQVGQKVTILQGGVPGEAVVTGKSTTVKPWAYEYTVKLPDESTRVFQATPEHVLFGAVGPTDGTYLYMMYRQGYGYRIGTSGKSGKMSSDDTMSIRTNQEGGEALWLLGSFTDRYTAIQEETQLSYRYQVPMVPFKPREDSAFGTIEATQRVFDEFGSNGLRVFNEVLHNPKAQPNPIYHAKASQSGRVAINVLISTRKGATELAIEANPELIPPEVAQQYAFSTTSKGTVRTRKYGPYAKLRAMAETFQALIPNSVIIEVLSLTLNDRRVFAVTAGSVVPGVLVPVVVGNDAILCPVVARTQVPAHTCYDLEVASAGHFVVNGIPVHNSIYAFRGAFSTLFTQAANGPDSRSVPISTNYRSGWGIVELGNLICSRSNGEAYNWAIGGRVQAGRKTPDGGTYLGKVTASGGAGKVKATTYYDEQGRLRQIFPKTLGVGAKLTDQISREMFENAQASGRQWREYAVITRTNADLGMAELSLTRCGIPCRYARNRTGFLFRTPVVRILKLLALGAGLISDGELAAEYLLDVLRNDQGQYWFGCLTYPSWSDKTKRISISPSVVSDHFQQHWTGNLLGILRSLGDLPRVKQKITKSGKLSKVGETWTIFHEIADQLRPVLAQSWPLAINAAADVISDWARRDDELRVKQKKEGVPEEIVEEVVEPDEDPREVYHSALCEMAKTFHSFVGFMDYVKLVRNTRKPADMDAVTLTTGHSAKGLEWSVTYVICESGRWPSVRATSEAEQAEERRTLYVAITRARDELHIRAGDTVGLGEHVYESLFERGLLAQMEDKELEIEKERKLREVVCVPEGDRWKLYKHGVPFPCDGVYYWHSAEQAQMAYLTAYQDTLTGWVYGLVESLRPTPMWAELSQSLSDEALQELIMQMCRDELVGAALGWTTLYSLISLAGYPADEVVATGDLIEFSDAQGVMGYLVPPNAEEPARYYGRMELYKPFRGISTRRVGADYATLLRNSSHHATSILDNSPTLFEARQRYVDYLHSLGLIPEIPVHAPAALVVEPATPPQIEEEEEPSTVTGPREEPISAMSDELSDEGQPHVDSDRYVRHILAVTTPYSDRQASSVCILDMTRPDYPLLTKLSLAGGRYLREFALVETQIRHAQKSGPDTFSYTLHQVVRTSEKDSAGRYKGKLVHVADTGFSGLSEDTRRAFGEQQHDDLAECFLSDPHIVPRDQALLEGHFLQDMKLDFGRITTERGYTLISSIYAQETEQRLIGDKCPWFGVVSRNYMKYLVWDVGYITATCGPVEPTE